MLRWLPVLFVLVLSGCGWFKKEPKQKGYCDPSYESVRERGDSNEDLKDQRAGKIFGGPINVAGGPPSASSSGSAMTVNATLWRAALDTVSFMPLSSVDPVGGVIITEWYSPINEPTERFKVDIIILGQSLRPDAIRVSLHKQRINAEGQWRSVEPSEDSVRELEDSILTRAQELRRGRSNY